MQLGVSLGIPYTLGKPSAAFSPLDLSPVLWLDASDTSTITESGGSVSQWDDKSGGTAYNLTQATAAAQPTTGVTTQNGKNVIDWVDDHMFNNSLSVADPCVVFFVLNRTVDTGTQVIYDDNGGGSRLISYWFSNSWRYFQGTIIDSGTNSTGWSVFTTVHDQASSEMRLDATQIATGNPGTQDTATFRIGNANNGVQPFKGSIAEFIIVNGTLTAGEIALMETYLADKWGITL